MFKCVQGIVCQLKIINEAYKGWCKIRQTYLRNKFFLIGLFETLMQAGKYAGLEEV